MKKGTIRGREQRIAEIWITTSEREMEKEEEKTERKMRI